MAVRMYRIPTATIKLLPQRFERKYYLVPHDVGPAYGLLRLTCRLAREYPSEQINSLYFDTADLDQHERSSSGDYLKDKIRIRWYGEDEDFSGTRTVFLELKSRRGFAGTKQRMKLEVPAEELTLASLHQGIVPGMLLANTMAGFGYFPSGVLLPVIRISYWRHRFEEMVTGQRLSLDVHIRSTMIMPGPGNGEKELELPGGVIEIKGQSMELPYTLRQVRKLYTDWTRFSKYSACIDSHTETPGTIGRLSPSGRVVLR
jgi:hypothetical protein